MDTTLTKGGYPMGSGIKVTNENVDDLIEKWHGSDSELELHEYLGLTWLQYAHFVETNELPKG